MRSKTCRSAAVLAGRAVESVADQQSGLTTSFPFTSCRESLAEVRSFGSSNTCEGKCPVAQSGSWTGDPVWLADVLRAEGVRLVEYPGWRDRGHGDFKDIPGVMVHHTGSDNATAASIAIGRPEYADVLLHRGSEGPEVAELQRRLTKRRAPTWLSTGSSVRRPKPPSGHFSEGPVASRSTGSLDRQPLRR